MERALSCANRGRAHSGGVRVSKIRVWPACMLWGVLLLVARAEYQFVLSGESTTLQGDSCVALADAAGTPSSALPLSADLVFRP